MYEDLELLLSTKVSPERVALLLDAAALLDELGMEGHRMELELLVHRHDSMDPIGFADEVDTVLRAGILSVIENHGIRVDESASLHWYTAMVRGLLLLPDYEDTAAVEAICEVANDPEAALADLLELVTEYSSEDFIVLLDAVSPRLLERLLQLFKRRADMGLDAAETEEDDDEGCANKMDIAAIRQRLLRYLDNQSFIITEAIRNGLPLGQQPEQLLKQFDRDLVVLSPRRAVEEVVAILIASCAKTEDIRALAIEYLEDLLADPRQIADAVIELDEVMREFLENGQA